jgi:hypothetical protein
MRRWAFVAVVYAGAAVAALSIANSDQNNLPTFYAIIAAASWIAGGASGSYAAAFLAVLLIPLAVPFGDTNQFTGGDDTDSLVLLAEIAAVLSVLLILLGAGCRKFLGRREASSR